LEDPSPFSTATGITRSAALNLSFFTIFFLEFLNSASSIHQFDLPSEEGVAGAADLKADFAPRGPSFKTMTACTGYLSSHVLGMDGLFHGNFLLLEFLRIELNGLKKT
jgi:hypothetical protein